MLLGDVPLELRLAAKHDEALLDAERVRAKLVVAVKVLCNGQGEKYTEVSGACPGVMLPYIPATRSHPPRLRLL